MIFVETLLTVSDNTETRNVKCIHLLGGGQQKSATVGDFVIITIKHRRYQRRLIFKKIYLGLIIGVKKEIKRLNGSYIISDYNRVVLLNELGKIIGTRILGPLYQEVKKYSKISKLISMSRGQV